RSLLRLTPRGPPPTCHLLIVKVWEEGVDLAGEVALEAADDVFGGETFGAAAGDVGAGGLVVAHAHDDGTVEGGVGVAVAAAVETVSAGGLTGAGGQWADAAEAGEGGFGA